MYTLIGNVLLGFGFGAFLLLPVSLRSMKYRARESDEPKSQPPQREHDDQHE